MPDKPSTIKLTRGVPPVEVFPTEQLETCSRTVLEKHGDIVLQYGPARGFPPLLEVVAEEYRVEPEQVLLGQGSLQLQDFVARLLLQPGAPVYVEEPSYDRAVTILKRAGGRVVALPLLGDGLDMDALARRLENEKPGLFYVVPNFQNPSGSVMSLPKRERLVELACQHRFWIIEDDPYRRLRYRGEDLPSLYSLAPDRVLAMSSYSKLLSPGLRVGLCVGVKEIMNPLTKMAEDTYINPSYFNQAIVYDYIRRGWMEPNVERLKALYRPRLDTMLAALDAEMDDLATWTRPDGGFFIGLTLNFPVGADTLLARAKEHGLVLSDGRGFFANRGGDNFVRLPFCALTRTEIEEGIARLAQVARALA